MEPWVIGMICNGIIATAYVFISLAITVPLARSGQLRSNPLGRPPRHPLRPHGPALAGHRRPAGLRHA